MGSNQEATTLDESESSKKNQPECEKQDSKDFQAEEMANQPDQPSRTLAPVTVSAQANCDVSMCLLIGCDKEVSLSSINFRARNF